VSDLHPHRLTRDFHVFVAPVELVCLARLEQQRDERRHAVTWVLASRFGPARGVAPDRIVRSLEAFAQQQIMMRVIRSRSRRGRASFSASNVSSRSWNGPIHGSGCTKR